MDIHSHIIFGVDDGAGESDTRKLLERESWQGNLPHYNCYPHQKAWVFEASNEIIKNFARVEEVAHNEKK